MLIRLFIFLILAPHFVFADTRPRVGVILPLTGEAASYGGQFKSGMMTNPHSSELDLHFEDSKFDSTAAIGAFHKLLDVDHVDALVSFGGATCEVLNQAAQARGLLHLAAGCNTAEFNKEGSTSFRLDVDESIAAAKTVDYFKEKKFQKVALVYVNNSWGQTIIERLRTAAAASSIKIVADLPFESGVIDIRSGLLKAKQSSPDVLFLISLPNLLPVVLKQIQESRLESPIVSSISVENPEVTRLAGHAADGIVYVSVKPDARSRAAAPAFFSRFPGGNPFAAWGYDSVSLLRKVDQQSDPKAALSGLKDFVGAFNAYTFDSKGELHLNYELREVQNGSYRRKSDI